MRSRLRRFAAGFAAILTVLPALGEPRFPANGWEQRRRTTWSAAGLEAARDYSASIKTAAVVIVQDGAVVDAWGETARKFNCHSMRKSLLSALYGIYVEDGSLRLSKTLAELGIDDNDPPLTPVEKRATVLDLLKARSGVYHPALYETPGMKALRPRRGSHEPGTFWYYNNWDFNVLGTIFEQETNTRIFDEFRKHIAEPLEMEDFTTEDGQYFTGADSVHPAYPIRMTARDLARFGLMFLREGRWRDRQIVPRKWVRESTKSYSNAAAFGDSRDGYGYMWWVREDSYSARGAGGHYLVVYPKMDLVVVHRVNTDDPRNSVSVAEFERLLEMILDAARGS